MLGFKKFKFAMVTLAREEKNNVQLDVIARGKNTVLGIKEIAAKHAKTKYLGLYLILYYY